MPKTKEQLALQAEAQVRRIRMSKEEKFERRAFLRRQTGCLSKADQQEINFMLAHGYHLEGTRIVPNK
jgi:hypothetical protein